MKIDKAMLAQLEQMLGGEIETEAPATNGRRIQPAAKARPKPITADKYNSSRPVREKVSKELQVSEDAVTVGEFTVQLESLGPKYNNAVTLKLHGPGIPYWANSFKPAQMKVLFGNPDLLEAVTTFVQQNLLS